MVRLNDRLAAVSTCYRQHRFMAVECSRRVFKLYVRAHAYANCFFMLTYQGHLPPGRSACQESYNKFLLDARTHNSVELS